MSLDMQGAVFLLPPGWHGERQVQAKLGTLLPSLLYTPLPPRIWQNMPLD